MRRSCTALGAVLAAVLLIAGITSPAPADAVAAGNGVVLVFDHEFTETTRYENPSGCRKLGPLAHLLVNLTDSAVKVHFDPFCLGPGLAIPAGYGTHVAPGTASFSA